MIEQRPYLNEISSYLYNLYDANLQQQRKDLTSTDLKVSIERSLLEFSRSPAASGIDQILKIDEFEKLIRLQSNLSTEKLDIIKKININNDLLKSLRANSKSESLISRSLDILEILNQKLLNVDAQLVQVTNKLQAHYSQVTTLGSVQAIVSSGALSQSGKFDSELAPSWSPDDSTSFEFVGSSYLDELVSHVASVAAQKDINLPPPASQNVSTESKLNWIKSCIDSILLSGSDYKLSVSTPITTSKNMAGTFQTSSPSTNDSKEIINLKTALKDLQFAHQYLTRQYEEERSVNTQTMSNLRLKLQNSQELLMKTNKDLSAQTQNLINLEMQLNEAEIDASNKSRQISDLTKQINLLKIDHLGEKTNEARLLSPPPSSSKEKDEQFAQSGESVAPLSPVTGVGFSVSNHGSRPSSGEYRAGDTKSSISNSILRLEFKKLLNDINAKHEQELANEQNERKKLENLIKMMNQENQKMSQNTD